MKKTILISLVALFIFSGCTASEVIVTATGVAFFGVPTAAFALANSDKLGFEKDKAMDKVPEAENKANLYANTMYMSKKAVYEKLESEYSKYFVKNFIEYLVINTKADWKENALKKAILYHNSNNMSSEGIKEQLTSESGDKFTKEEAEYAIENLPK